MGNNFEIKSGGPERVFQSQIESFEVEKEGELDMFAEIKLQGGSSVLLISKRLPEEIISGEVKFRKGDDIRFAYPASQTVADVVKVEIHRAGKNIFTWDVPFQSLPHQVQIGLARRESIVSQSQ